MPNHYNPLLKAKNNRRKNDEPLTLEKVNAILGIKKNGRINPLRLKTRRSTRRSARRN